ncbi:TolB family protein [Dyella tabacisoli]|uniref:Exo-alpha-sialidase n=1 Tax=Dyella tabacisoli TaxID=2282381 RepID=A0A369USC8_9GAMM|nr:PD40 domain-containing protein [Dyella tabacisoli]RDD83377.1 hypothetical protein DVJ77_01990 [Dyella tabacisoli]
MSRPIAGCLLAVLALAANAASPSGITPEVFAPGVISAGTNVFAPAFSPDGRDVYFTSATAQASTIMVSHRQGEAWSAPQVASFSGQWGDLEPAMAPDGSFLLFASSRPATAGGQPLDGVFNGKTWPGAGGNLWRVDRHGDGWGAPQHLPAIINGNTGVFSPSVAADGSLYFMQPDPVSGNFHIWHSTYAHGRYLAAQALSPGDADSEEVDPAIAPDQSFMVFSQRHPLKKDRNRLQIVFRQGDGWSAPLDLGDAVNGAGGNIESRLGIDGHTLYFSSSRSAPVSYPRSPAQADTFVASMQNWDNGTRHIWRISLLPWLEARQATHGATK